MRLFARLPRSPESTSRPPLARRLRLEALEDRRVLAVLTVNSLLDDVTPGDNLVTLREAVAAANDDSTTDLGATGAGADQIVFDASLFSSGAATLTLDAGELVLSSDIAIQGPGRTLLTISGNDASRIFNIDDGDGGESNAQVSLADFTVAQGLANGLDDAGRGGAIFSVENLSIQRVDIRQSVAGSDGGGLLASIADGGVLSIVDSTITGNTSATGIGGGLSVQVLYDGVATLTNLTVENNAAGFGGGGAALGAGYGGTVALRDSRIAQNQAEYGGGVLIDAFEQGDVALERATVSGNTATGSEQLYDLIGGGVAIFSDAQGSARISQSTISGNSGGGIAAINGYQGVLQLAESAVRDNLGVGPNSYGGAGMQVIADELSTTEIVRSEISGNVSLGPTGDLGVAGGAGGGLYLYGYQTITTIRDSTIANNRSSASGGGLYLVGYASQLNIVGSTISGNQADASGGGLYLYHDLSSPVSIAHSTITGNQADVAATGLGAGGGILSYAGMPLLNHTILAGNSSLSGVGPDLYGSAAVNYTLVGNNQDASLTIAGSGNLIGTSSTPLDPGLGPLANHGGPAPTHALQANSPALDAGDPNIAGEPAYDQRGFPYVRIVGAKIDLGAYESQTQPADFDSDLKIGGSDFLAWQRGYGTTSGATLGDGDADRDGDVDEVDLAAWEATFGVGTPASLVALAMATSSAADVTTQTPPAPLPSPNIATELPAAVARDRVFGVLGADASEGTDIAVVRNRPLPRLAWSIDDAPSG